MEWIELSLGGLVGLVTSLSLIPIIIRFSKRHGLGNRAGEEHHTHSFPIPRLGGLALAGAMAMVVIVSIFLEPDFLQTYSRWLIITGSLSMFALGLWDDLFVLGARRKLFGQIAIASATYFCGIGIEHFRVPFTDKVLDLGLWAWPVTVFWLVAMTNLINLIDGIDGLAGGICLMLMILMVYVSSHSNLVPLLAAGMVGALLGFLRYNFPPARIYLGDGGAYFLGFMIGCMTVVTSQKGTIFAALAAPLFVLALPIIDTSLAILRRGLRGLPLFRPDRKHLHHRLLNLGYSRRKVVVGLYLFTAFFLMLGFLAFFLHGQYFALFLGLGILVVILTAGKFNFSREWFAIGRTLGNSIESRADIRYAMALSQCLALEGARSKTIGEMAESLIYISRKLGFAHVRLRLEDDEQVWHLNDAHNDRCGLSCQRFRHALPDHKYCFVEFCVTCPDTMTLPRPGLCNLSEPTLNKLSIQADLISEAWGKAIEDWKKAHKLPVRFDATPPAPTAGEPELAKQSEPAKPIPRDIGD
jgi:UDP-GlcNAc:undecaprenyl-phosphate GlcNAc-1-phosphate transferase